MRATEKVALFSLLGGADMSEVNPLLKAHLLLMAWGQERLARSAAEGEQLADRTPSAAADGSGVGRLPHLQNSTTGGAYKRPAPSENGTSHKLADD